MISLVPLSPNQDRLWYLHRLAPDCSAYNMPLAFEGQGPLDVDALAAAWLDVGRELDSLRTRFVESDDGVRQYDAGDLPPLKQDSAPIRDAAARRVTELARRPFDLLTESGVAAHLVSWNQPGRWFLLLNIHHLLGDGPSLRIIQQSLASHYRRRVGNLGAVNGDPLRREARSFLTYAQRARADWNRDRGQSLAAWRRLLADAPARLELPGRVTPANRVADPGSVACFQLAAEDVRRCRQLTHRLQTPSGTMFLSLFAVLLRQLSQQDELVIGVASDGRTSATREVAGFLAATVPVPTKPSFDSTFAEFVTTTRGSLWEALQHQHVPYHQIVDAVARPELVDNCFVFHNRHLAELQLDGIATTHFPLDLAWSMFALTMRVLDLGTEIQVQWEYSTETFSRGDVERLQDRLVKLLVKLAGKRDADDPDPTARTLGRLCEVEGEERDWILRAGRDAELTVPEGTVVDLIAEHARHRPHRVAVVDSTESVSYGELWDRAGRLAGTRTSCGAVGSNSSSSTTVTTAGGCGPHWSSRLVESAKRQPRSPTPLSVEMRGKC